MCQTCMHMAVCYVAQTGDVSLEEHVLSLLSNSGAAIRAVAYAEFALACCSPRDTPRCAALRIAARPLVLNHIITAGLQNEDSWNEARKIVGALADAGGEFISALRRWEAFLHCYVRHPVVGATVNGAIARLESEEAVAPGFSWVSLAPMIRKMFSKHEPSRRHAAENLWVRLQASGHVPSGITDGYLAEDSRSDPLRGILDDGVNASLAAFSAPAKGVSRFSSQVHVFMPQRRPHVACCSGFACDVLAGLVQYHGGAARSRPGL